MSAGLLKVSPPADRFSRANQSAISSAKAQNIVRRPTRGITLRNDTFATMRVVTGSGTNMRVIDAGSRLKDGNEPARVTIGDRTYVANEVYSNFFLQNVMEERQEKSQILETFGEPYIFLFGERPRIMAFQGILLNTWDFNWEAEWWANYDSFLRGTKCVENDARVYLAFDNTLVGGYILSANAQKTAQDRNYLQFQFQLFVTYYESFSNLGDNRSFDQATYGNVSELITNDSAESFLKDRPLFPLPLESASLTVGADGKVFRPEPYRDALKNQPSSLAQAWRSVQRTTRMVLSTASQVLSGEVVRVPQGFEGSFAYGDVRLTTKELKKAETQVVKYSTFDMNDDEYVGASSQYGSAALRFEDQTETIQARLEAGKTISGKAKEFWIEQGLTPDPGLVTTLAAAVKAAKVSLIAVNAVQAAAGVARRGTGAATPNMTGSVFNWSGSGGGMLKRSQDNAYPG